MRKFFDPVFAGLIIIFCGINIFWSWPQTFDDTWRLAAGNSVPGESALPFKKLLQGVSAAGYQTDRYCGNFWYSPELIWGFQRLQYSLSPVMLDIDGYRRHEYIIFDCEKPGCYLEAARALDMELVSSQKERLFLMRKRRTP